MLFMGRFSGITRSVVVGLSLLLAGFPAHAVDEIQDVQVVVSKLIARLS